MNGFQRFMSAVLTVVVLLVLLAVVAVAFSLSGPIAP